MRPRLPGWLVRVLYPAPGGDVPQLESAHPATASSAADGPQNRRHTSVPPRRKAGVIYTTDYMDPEREEQTFRLGSDGLPTGRLVRRNGRLVLVPDSDASAMVNPSSRRLHRTGVHVFRVRGITHHAAALRAGDMAVGKAVRLVREPDNEHDANAIAVYAARGSAPVGYVNRQNAARLAPMLDAGMTLEAITLRGEGPGREGPAPVVLVAAPEVMSHLLRTL